MFIRLDKTPECDGMTDGRNPVASTAVCIASNAYALYLSSAIKSEDTEAQRYSLRYRYDFLLVNKTNSPPILHRFLAIADYWSNFR